MTESDRLRPGEILVPEEELRSIVSDLGKRISRDYEGRNPVLVNLLKGGVIFLADLVRRITVPHQIDFLSVSSYEDGMNSSGVVRIVEDLKTNIAGRHVLIIEDIVDTGTTLAYIYNMLRLRMPASLEVCTLLRKETDVTIDVPIKYLGKSIPDVFVVGYGLDYRERYRHLPYIARLVTD